MLLALLVLVPSLFLGYLGGGRLQRLTTVRFARSWAVVVAAFTQATLAVIALFDGPVGTVARPLLVVSLVAVAAFVWANRRLPGMWIALAGFALNALVILLNGGMPVDPSALAWLGGETAVDPGKHLLLTERTRLPWLADVIPVPLVGLIVSAGDIVLALGVGILVARLMRGLPRHSEATRAHRLDAEPPGRPGGASSD